MDDPTALADTLIQQVTQQQRALAQALHWQTPKNEPGQERPPTPLHADLALLVAIANGERDRSAIDDPTLGDIIERFQRLLDLLFKPVSGYYGYSLEGLVACYVAAIPFWQNSLIADFTATALVFAIYLALTRAIPSVKVPA